MAPVRSSTRRPARPPQPAATPPHHAATTIDPNVNSELFLDPMLGTPLTFFVEKDVAEKELISELVAKHGGTVSPGYSGVTYILVDPHKPSGQNLWRQYVGKKGKVILNARWVHECITANQLQTFASNWAGCKVTGNEAIYQSSESRPPDESVSSANREIQSIHPQALQNPMPPVEPMQSFPFVYNHPLSTSTPRPTMSNGQWQVTVPPAQTHIPPPTNPQPQMMHRQPEPQSHTSHYREDGWDGYNTADEMSAQQSYDFRYGGRDDHSGWVGPGPYYDTYESYPQPPYVQDPTEQASGSTSVAGQTQAPNEADKRGRKRTRTQAPPAPPASSLVINRNPPARSPTPPTRVIKSTYGGNLFTADDVLYLKKYIDYCQEQCLVLSLREICERIAVKAPHHTFYSWRRYCNKHQIRLGGYAMNHDRSESPLGEDLNMDMDADMVQDVAAEPNTLRLDMSAATAAAASAPQRNRSPTPPRALFRSTTGKGVAFTQEDVTFLVRFMEYRKSQSALDMVAFWKEVAMKAPHHSRASWMKFWRRHKHELARSEGDEPLPAPPEKKMRYSKNDDILLARYFVTKPDGTSDKIFQAFGRLHPHHPWKGWQEHHRIHKTKIEHLMRLLAAGGDLENEMDES